MTAVLFIIGAYLWGSIPSAYLAARYFRNIDIREYGSGNVGAANVFSQLGKRAGWILGTFDSMGKGALPVFLANLLDQSLAVQAATDWPPSLATTGRPTSGSRADAASPLPWGSFSACRCGPSS